MKKNDQNDESKRLAQTLCVLRAVQTYVERYAQRKNWPVYWVKISSVTGILAAEGTEMPGEMVEKKLWECGFKMEQSKAGVRFLARSKELKALIEKLSEKGADLSDLSGLVHKVRHSARVVVANRKAEKRLKFEILVLQSVQSVLGEQEAGYVRTTDVIDLLIQDIPVTHVQIGRVLRSVCANSSRDNKGWKYYIRLDKVQETIHPKGA